MPSDNETILMPGLRHDFRRGRLLKNMKIVESLNEMTDEEIENVKTYFDFYTDRQMMDFFGWDD